MVHGAVLEEVRMLSNLETEHEKLLQIVFIGQPELKKKLALPKLEQLRQRVSVYYQLGPLTFDETMDYIHYRLRLASGGKDQFFTPEAILSIYEFAKGIPRVINQLCDSALLTGYLSETRLIDHDIIREVIS